MLYQRCFLDLSYDLTLRNVIASFLQGDKLPFLFLVECRNYLSSSYKVPTFFSQYIKRPLNAIINRSQKAWTELDRKRPLRIDDFFSRSQTSCIFVYLNCRIVPLKADN